MTRRHDRREILEGVGLAGATSFAGCASVLGSLQRGSFETGVRQWHTDLPGEPSGLLSTGGSVLYVGTTGPSGGAGLHALALSSGATRWQRGFDGGTSGVALRDGTVYAGTMEGRVAAVEATTGRNVWTTDGLATIQAAPAVDDRAVYAGDADGSVVAVDAESGGLRWTASTNWRVWGGPRVIGRRLLVGGKNLLFAFDPATGDRRWETLVAGRVQYPVSGHDSAAYVAAASTVHRIEPSTGERVWRFDADNLVGGSPAVAGDRIYVASHDHHLYAVDSATGEEAWSLGLSELPVNPIVDGDTVYAGTRQGSLYAVDAESGTPQWRVELAGGVSTLPSVDDGVVYVADQTGTVSAFSGPD